MADRGSAQEAFANAVRLLDAGRGDLARQQLGEILAAHPDEVNALRLLGMMRLADGDAGGAVELLARVVDLAPGFRQAAADLRRARRIAGGASGQSPTKPRARRAADRNTAAAWQRRANDLVGDGELAAGRAAFRRAAASDPERSRIAEALSHLKAGRRREAEARFREVLKGNPDHIHALVGLAHIAIDAGALADAERLLRRAQTIAPGLDTVWRGLARLHSERADHTAAERAARRAVELAPESADCWTMLGTVQAWGLQPEAARIAFEKSLAVKPEQPRVALSLGHVHKTLGRRAASVAAYRRAAVLDAGLGEAFWSLADLKTYEFDDAEMERMRLGLARADLQPTERAAFHFALGKALEDRNQCDVAFEHYAAGNAIKHRIAPFDCAGFAARRRGATKAVTSAFLAARKAPASASAPTPIFIVGLPRSGSTLLEQMLASHSAVQGTMELPHILTYVRELETRGGFPAALEALQPRDFAALGLRYLRETAALRGDAPWFIDKMPNNFAHIGLIHAMLPQAVFIDARRAPMACCFSVYKQNFARGQTFSYDLGVLGAYYQEYLAYMKHWQRALPGRVLRCQYEDVVAGAEAQVRRLLAHCGLPFEAACLRFHETRRPVRTASAEQVRRPIYSGSVDAWRRFESHLAPLRRALGPALDEYRD